MRAVAVVRVLAKDGGRAKAGRSSRGEPRQRVGMGEATRPTEGEWRGRSRRGEKRGGGVSRAGGV